MTKLRKMIALLACIALAAAAFTACGKDSDNNNKTSGDSSKTQDSGKDASQNDTSEKAEAEYIVIGSVNDVSGPTAALGTAMVNIFQYMVDDINAAGGILGKQVKFINYDTANDPSETILAYKRVVEEDGACVVLGTTISGTQTALAPVTSEVKVPVVGIAIDPSCVIDDKGNVYPYSFMAQSDAEGQAKAAAYIAMDYLNHKTIGVLYNQSNAYANSLQAPFIRFCEEKGATIYVETFQDADQDLRTQLTKLMNKECEIIYEPNQQAHQAIGVTQAREIGYINDLLSNNGANPYILDAGEDAENNTYFPYNVSPDSDEVLALTDRYMKDYGINPAVQGIMAADAFKLMQAAIEEAGAAEPEAIRDALENVTVEGLQGTLRINPDTHKPDNLPMYIMNIQNGKMVTLGQSK